LLTFTYNVSIREAIADTLATMLKAIKKTATPEITLKFAQSYIEALFTAMEKEVDTNVMIHQVSGIKH